MASDANQIGLWYVAGGHEYQQNGPDRVRVFRRHRAASSRSNRSSPTMAIPASTSAQTRTGRKYSGHGCFTSTARPTVPHCWADSQQQALAEKNLIGREVVAQAIKDLGVDPEKIQPQIV
jgi:hypothetical protein